MTYNKKWRIRDGRFVGDTIHTPRLTAGGVPSIETLVSAVMYILIGVTFYFVALGQPSPILFDHSKLTPPKKHVESLIRPIIYVAGEVWVLLIQYNNE